MALRITVIGAGPGGYTAAFEAARRGAEVTLVESHDLGGTCLNRGCIPTKALKSSAEALEAVKRAAEFGIAGAGEPLADMPAVLARKARVVETLRGGLAKACAQRRVKLVQGRARLVSASLVQVAGEDGAVQDIASDRVIVATGSSVLRLPSLPCDGRLVLTSDEALELGRIPARLLVVGGGVVGCELAFVFRSFGSEVTVVEGLDRLLPVPSVDQDMSRLLLREAKKRGIRAELCRTVAGVRTEGDRIVAELAPSPFVPEEKLPASAKKPAAVECDCVFSTVGRVPNTGGLGLEEAGVAVDARGWIAVDGSLQTSLPGVYAVGDVLGPSRIMLAHMAEAEAPAAVAACFGEKAEPEYAVCPSGIFTTPEIGCVGLTEEQARARGFDVACPQILFRELGKAHAMGELAGVFKLVADRATGKLLGVHVAGAHATDLIAEAALALHQGCTADDLAATIHAHPTLAEGMLEAALKFRQ